MNMRVIASVLKAEQELERVEHSLRRRQEWQQARRISTVRAALAEALTEEQQVLSTLFARYQQTPA